MRKNLNDFSHFEKGVCVDVRCYYRNKCFQIELTIEPGRKVKQFTSCQHLL